MFATKIPIGKFLRIFKKEFWNIWEIEITPYPLLWNCTLEWNIHIPPEKPNGEIYRKNFSLFLSIWYYNMHMVEYIQMELPFWHDLMWGCGQYRHMNKEPWIEFRDGNYKKKEEKRKKIRNRQIERKKIDPNFKIRMTLRSRMSNAFKQKKIKKKNNSFYLIGCTVEKAMEHIEKQFKEGMSWENHGIKGWHIDHIIPCASFDLSDPEQQKKCFHYTNLQPLWAHENLSKNCKVPDNLKQKSQ